MGFLDNDDAGVYRLSKEIALITTADFITPPVDDPFQFGQIAAANALSDVYAMGGRPVTCLNLVCFPAKKLEASILNRIVAGALDMITEAGAVLAGGHTIEDVEPKFGLAVTGLVHPDNIWTNAGAKPGDVLLLTKPLGSGVLFNANLKKWVSRDAMEACLSHITQLNKKAAEIMREFDVHAATDVTGFGLAGHAFEMAAASGVRLEINIRELPVMKEALDMYRKGVSTGVNHSNKALVKKHTVFEIAIPSWHREIVYDPQTNGGLLTALSESQANDVLRIFHREGMEQARIIGRVKAPEGPNKLFFQ